MTLRVKDIPNNYDRAKRLLGNRGSRKISKNGWLFYSPDPDIILLQLFNTAIVRYYSTGWMSLHYGRYPTKTTCAWINSALKYYDKEDGWDIKGTVYKEKGVVKYCHNFNNAIAGGPTVDLPVLIDSTGKVLPHEQMIKLGLANE